MKIKSYELQIMNNELKDYFHQNYSKHKFIKIQEQYIYHSDTTAQEFLKKVLNKKTNLEHNFQLIDFEAHEFITRLTNSLLLVVQSFY